MAIVGKKKLKKIQSYVFVLKMYGPFIHSNVLIIPGEPGSDKKIWFLSIPSKKTKIAIDNLEPIFDIKL